MTYIQASCYTVKFGGFELAPLLKSSLRYAQFGFQKRLTVIPNVYTMSLHRLFTMLLLTETPPLQVVDDVLLSNSNLSVISLQQTSEAVQTIAFSSGEGAESARRMRRAPLMEIKVRCDR